jgi:hypothetical protein
MSFESILADVGDSKKRLVIYAPDGSGTDLATRLETRNMTVDHRRVPSISADAFVIVREGGRFRGALPLVDLLRFLSPGTDTPRADHSHIYDLFDDTVFVSLDRAQLLATSRELEDRAFRTGRGRLHVGFQRAAALEPQRAVYREIADLDIDIHLYVPGADAVSTFDDTSVTVHTEPDNDLERYWFVLFDDGDDGRQNCALIAREEDDGRYRGVWTYDPALVERAFAAVE